MPPRIASVVPVLAATLIIGGCALILFTTRVASGPVLALLRQLMGEAPLGPSAYWLTTGVVLIGAPLAGWWVDQAGRRVAIGAGVATVAAGLTLMGFLLRQAWMPLYVLVAFGVVLVGVSAATTVAVIARRAALATALAFCLPFTQLVPNVPPGMQSLFRSGERGFVLLGLAYLLAALLPLLAIAIGVRLERRSLPSEAEIGPPVDGPTTLDGFAAAIALAACGWISQIGAAAADLSRTFPPSAPGQSLWPAIVVLLASLSSYVWAIGADAWTRPSGTRASGGPVRLLVALAFGVFAAGAVLVAVAQGMTLLSAGMFLAGIGMAGVVPIVVAAHLRGVEPTRWGGAIGLAIGMYMFGQTLGARVNLYVAAWIGAIGVVVALGAAGAAVAAWMSRTGRGVARPASDAR